MDSTGKLTIAYTPDSDDAFCYFALETGRIRVPGYLPEFRRKPIGELNLAAREGTYEVTAISSVAYPAVADRFAILSVGTSVGRGYGPVLVSQGQCTPEDLRGGRVGVGGVPTTGWFLLRLFCPDAVPVMMPFDRIADAVAAGELDAGVMIHEELLYYPRLGLCRVMDLGAEWCRRTGHPLPVGLNVVRRDLGRATMDRLCAAIRRSLEYGLRHRREALEWAASFGRGAEGRCTGRFVEMFANDDSLRMRPDVRGALRMLFREAVHLNFAPSMPPLDIVEGTRPLAASAADPA
jgi:1,4-dihydroxy-6-naphthoate synthase